VTILRNWKEIKPSKYQPKTIER